MRHLPYTRPFYPDTVGYPGTFEEWSERRQRHRVLDQQLFAGSRQRLEKSRQLLEQTAIQVGFYRAAEGKAE